MPDTLDAIVVGGGAMGCASAYYLAKQGLRVRVVEAGRIGGGASHGNCGYICPSHALPLTAPGAVGKTIGSAFNPDAALYIKPRLDPALWSWLTRFASRCRTKPMMQAAQARNALLASSMSLYRELLADESIDVEWQDRGLLFVFKSAEEFEAYGTGVELARREFGVRFDPYEGSRLTELEPALRPELAGAWHCPTDAHLRPDRLMSAMRGLLTTAGVELSEGVRVQHINGAGGQATSLDTSAGPMRAPLFVLTTGAEAPHLADRLGCRLPIQPGKGYSITLPRPASGPTMPMILEESHVAVTPWASGLRIGSTMEFVGYDRSINRRRIELFRRAAAEHLVEAPTGPVEEEWSGWRPMTYDEIPCIGRAPKLKNVIVAAGHGMIGMSTMTATGKLVSELATDATPHIDPAPYALERFGRG